jgi:hypothetical protein
LLKANSGEELSESIRKNRLRPMYADANMGHPSSVVTGGVVVTCGCPA